MLSADNVFGDLLNTLGPALLNFFIGGKEELFCSHRREPGVLGLDEHILECFKLFTLAD